MGILGSLAVGLVTFLLVFVILHIICKAFDFIVEFCKRFANAYKSTLTAYMAGHPKNLEISYVMLVETVVSSAILPGVSWIATTQGTAIHCYYRFHMAVGVALTAVVIRTIVLEAKRPEENTDELYNIRAHYSVAAMLGGTVWAVITLSYFVYTLVYK